jgi:hypothetical protein
MSYGTIGGMKVVAIKGIEKDGNLWEVRYTRLTKRGVQQEAYFSYDTPDAAKAKYRELLDVLVNQHGVYVGRKEKRKLRASRRESGR